jgi:acyl carrier protein phosphodiesterase
MNFLAHLFLTKDYTEEISVGNFIADAVKGQKAISKFPLHIQRGIRIHREIDSFTDAHPLVRIGTKRLHNNYGKFAGIIVDIFYDHILAVNWHKFSEDSLDDFAQKQYKLITTHWIHLPDRTRYWYQYMYQNNLLVTYARESVIELVLQRMDKRLGSISGMGGAIEELKDHLSDYTQEFITVFQEIQKHISLTFPIEQGSRV